MRHWELETDLVTGMVTQRFSFNVFLGGLDDGSVGIQMAWELTPLGKKCSMELDHLCISLQGL